MIIAILCFSLIVVTLCIILDKTKGKKIAIEECVEQQKQQPPKPINVYNKYIDTYVEEMFGENAVWKITDSKFSWWENISVPLLIISADMEQKISVNKSDVFCVYKEKHKKTLPKLTPAPVLTVADKWLYQNLPEIEILVNKKMQENRKESLLEYPCDIERKYQQELLEKLCETTNYDFYFKKNYIVVDYHVYMQTVYGVDCA